MGIINKKIIVVTLIILVTIYCLNTLDIDILVLLESIPSFTSFLINEFLPPDFSYLGKYLPLMLDAILVSFYATSIASLIAFILAILSARNTRLIPGLNYVITAVNTVLRNIPFLVWASILVLIFGLGITSGIIALIIFGVSFLTRIFSEAIEDIDQESINSLYCVGAPKIFVIRKAIIPLFMPTFYNWITFMFEINLRASAILGLVGAGGIGYELKNSLSLFRYGEASLIILLLAITILISEFVMNKVRKGLI